MSFLATLGAVAKAAASALGLLEKRQDQLDRQEFKSDGAKAQQNEDLKAENEALRKRMEVVTRPSEVGDDLNWLRRRSRELRGPAGDKPDDS